MRFFCFFCFLGEITTLISLDRESRASYELVAEARDQGATPRSGRVSVRIAVADVNDNAPEIVDPGEDVVRVREEQPIGIDVSTRHTHTQPLKKPNQII